MVKKSNEAEVIEKIILDKFSFLETDYLYEPNFELKENYSFEVFGIMEYLNEVKRRKVKICYTKSSDNNQDFYSFTLSLTRIPHNGWEDMISFNVYLDSKGKDFNTSIKGAFQIDEADLMLQKLATEFKKELLDVIEGNIWYENYYPRKD